MPLLGKKIYSPSKPSKDILQNEKVFTIPFTGERFRSKSEYDKRYSLYKEKIWTCQCTGHVNLSYEEAYKSEKAAHKTLKDQFGECFEKPTLEIVHHATVSLDNLVDQAWTKIQQVLFVGEKVALKVKAAGRIIKGTIVSVDNCGIDVNPTNNCSSPSSDKENNNSKDHPKKWQPPKLLPYKYSMRLDGEEKVINAIPASDLARCERPPSKDLIRLFIRAYTVRAGQTSTSPWIVDDKMVHKYKLPKKFADFLLSSAKMTRITPEMVEEFSIKRKMAELVVESSSDDDEIVLSEVIRKSIGKTDASSDNDSSDSDVPLVKLKSKNNSNDSNSEDKPLSKLGSGKKSPKKTSLTKSKDSKKKDEKKKKLKQMTLFELANKKGGKSPNKNSPRKWLSSPVNVTPPIVTQMIKAHEANKEHMLQELMKKAVKCLNATQRNNLPSSIKEEFMKKYEIFREKKLLAKMTPEERENYFKRKKKLREQESKKKFEDQQLKLQPLPQPKLVSCPESLPNEVFGDVAMVTEFISCFKGLLMPNDEYPIYSDALMKALSNGLVGYSYLNRVLDILLQTLLQDRIAEGYEELKTKLNNIPINSYTASELVRLCLRSNDSGQEINEEADDEEEFVDVPQNVIEKLEDKEFYQLNATDKLAILKGLCLRIMGSYSVQDYMEGKQTQANKLMRQKCMGQKELNEQLKKQDETDEDQPKDAEDKADSDAPATPADSTNPENEDDIISTVRNRRVNAAKVAAEKAKKEKLRRKEVEKSMIEQKKQRALKAMQETIEAARHVLRFVPIGFDRHHNRYWMFSKTTPGLYIEKGWFTQDYNHCVNLDADNCSEDDKPIAALSTPTKQNGSTSPKKSPKKSAKKALSDDPSIPQYTQNLWFEYDSSKDLDDLIVALHRQGIRESGLKREIKKRYDDISKAIYRSRRTNLELRESNGDVETLHGIQKELLELEVRLRNGGLGGVPDFKSFEKRVETSEDLKDFNELLLEVEGHVLEKFLKYFMKGRQQLTTVTSVKQEESDYDDDEEDEDDGGDDNDGTKKKVTHKHRQRWRDAVKNCATYSRFHVLMGMLEYCVRWDKSVEAAKCKICRKKGNDDTLLLCDECNLAFHMYCLRPALTDVPEGEWFCAACVHKKKPIQFYPSRGKIELDVIEEERPVIEHELTCTICGGDEDLINCSECPMSYHTFCHDPEFRYPPRGHWKCMKCKGGTRKRRKAPIYIPDDDSCEDDDYEPNLPKFKKASRKKKIIFEPDDSPPRTSRRAPSELSICEEILNELVKNKDSWPFAEAVNKRAVPDYHTIVKHPMDFRTMKNKFLTYSSAQEFVDDLALVFRNSALYNKEDSDIYQCMLNMEKQASKLVSSRLPNHIYSRDVVANGYDDHGYSSKRSRRR